MSPREPVSLNHRVSRAVALFTAHDDLPGYDQMPWLTRKHLDLGALNALARSAEGHWLIVAVICWQLLAHILIWQFDLYGARAAVPPSLVCVWLWPWLADARRRQIHRLLGCRWSSGD